MVSLLVGTAVDDESIRRASTAIQRRFDNLSQDIGADFGSNLADGLTSASPKIVKAMDRAADATGRVTTEMARLEELRSSGTVSNARLIAQSEKVAKARRDEARAITDVVQAHKRYAESGEDARGEFLKGLMSGAGFSQAGDSAAEGFAGGFAGSGRLAMLGAKAGPVGLALAGVATVGLAAGKVLADAMADGLADLQARDLIAAQMGIDDETARQYGKAAAEAWSAGWGDSAIGNLDVIKVGVQSQLLGDGEDPQRWIEQVMAASQVLGEAPQSIARGARTAVVTGMVGSVAEALDLFITANERGLNVSGELLDSMQEYATQFRAVGIKGRDAFGLMWQMFDAGAPSVDKAADVLKEFAIRAVDDSDASRAAFEALGFSADDMGARFAAGGESARSAFGTVIDAINGVSDPLERNKIGVALMGTQWEDVGDSIRGADLKTAATDLGTTAGATDDLAAKLQENADGWDTLGRKASDALDRIKRSLAESGLGRFFMQDVPGVLSDLLIDPNTLYQPIPGVSSNPGMAPPVPVDPSAAGDTLIPGQDVIGGITGAPSMDIFGNMFNTAPGTPAPDGVLTPPVDAPVPGATSPFDDALDAQKDAGKDPKKTKPVIDPSRYSLDSIPVGQFPGLGDMPDMGALPVGQNTQSGPMVGPDGKVGYYEVDDSKVYDARTSVMSAKSSAEQARLKVLELEADAEATASEVAAARQNAMTAERRYQSALMKLAEAQQGTWKKMESTAKTFTSGMQDIGAALDDDFGLSEGLPGLVDNLVRMLGAIAAAPITGPLSAIAAANPSQGGSGILGALGAQGVFGDQFTGITQVDPASYYYGAQATGYGMPSRTGPVGAAKPGESDRAFAHRVMKPYFEAQGLTVGDHQADQYGEHQNGALDIMVDNLAQGQKVLQQVLGDPNVYGAIFDNQVYGYGQGLTPRPYSAGNTGNPTQDHQDHVHAWYKPGNAGNLPVPSQSTTQAAPSYPSTYSQGIPPLSVTNETAAGLPSGSPGMPGQSAYAGPSPYLAQPVSSVMQGGQWGPGPGSESGGVGLSGDGAIGMAMDAGSMAMDMMAPGAGQLAKMGVQAINRTIGFGSQVAGILAGGLMETMSFSSQNPLTDPMKTLPGRLLAGVAGARPNLPNAAGQSQQAQQQPGQQPGQPAAPGGPMVNIENVHQAPEQPPDSVANSVANQFKSYEISNGFKSR